MNVAALQEHLSSLASVVDEASGKRTAGDGLRAVRDALAPFHDQQLRAFADFLSKAEEYQRTGVLTPKKAATSRGKNAAQPGAIVEVLRRQLTELYDSAPTASDEQINLVMESMAPRAVTKAILLQLASAVKVEGAARSAKNNDAIRKLIRDAITIRRAMDQRRPQ